MTYAAASLMRRSASLKGRIESSAYAHDQTMQWVDRNIATLVVNADWVQAWTTAFTAAITDGDMDRDLGISNSVITDDMIDTAIQALVTQQASEAATAQSATEQKIADLTQQVADLTQQVATLTQTGTTTAGDDTSGQATA